MTTSEHLAQHFKQVYFGGNWTVSCLKSLLDDVTLDEAIVHYKELNSIATLSFHIHYFVQVATKVLEGGPLEGNDKLSFDPPNFQNEQEWNAYKKQLLKEGEQFVESIQQLDDIQLNEYFTAEKFGTYFRNINGIIEHTHYHLGQIAIIKKLIR